MAEKGKLSCHFDDKSGAATIVKNGAVLASSTNLERPMQILSSDQFDRIGDLVGSDSKTSLPKIVNEGFHVDLSTKRCDATLPDGQKLERVPMVRHDFAPK
ncbi:MAG: hypothetical protein AAB276_00155 [Pseudomonadota bacterium]